MSAPKKISNPTDADGMTIFCNECKWYRGTILSGVCRGVPPSTLIVGIYTDAAGKTSPQLGAYFPVVDGTGYCGAFVADRDKELDELPLPQMVGKAEGSA